jgi:hypothetical protein
MLCRTCQGEESQRSQDARKKAIEWEGADQDHVSELHKRKRDSELFVRYVSVAGSYGCQPGLRQTLAGGRSWTCAHLDQSGCNGVYEE